MTAPWLHVVGIGEDGLGGLCPAARALVLAAEVVVGGERHLAMAPPGAERMAWPSPWSAMADRIRAHRGRRVVVLVTGDPAWFSGGVTVARAFAGEAVVHPHPGAFALAAARLLWRIEDCECLSLHGRPAATVIPALAPGARLLLLGEAGTAAEVAAILAREGYGRSLLRALWRMGGDGEGLREAPARDWSGETPALTTLAVECVADPGRPPRPRWGLPDEAFDSDGTMTKREVRSLTLARLAPLPGQMLWDVGLGAGSVAIEWMRAARGTRAVGVEPRGDRRARAAANALALGVPDLGIVAGEAPAALAGLPDPDAVFLGGGLSEATFAAAWDRLRPGGRLVANAVTLESEAVLLALHARHGGDLVRIAVSRAEPVGRLHGWRPAMEVTQWSLVRG